MTGKEEKIKKKKEKKIDFFEEKQKKLLERLGFVQLVLDFYSGPVA